MTGSRDAREPAAAGPGDEPARACSWAPPSPDSGSEPGSAGRLRLAPAGSGGDTGSRPSASAARRHGRVADRRVRCRSLAGRHRHPGRARTEPGPNGDLRLEGGPRTEALGPGDGRVLPRAAGLPAESRPGRQPGGPGRARLGAVLRLRRLRGRVHLVLDADAEGVRRPGRAVASVQRSRSRALPALHAGHPGCRLPAGARSAARYGAGHARPRRGAGDDQPDGVAAQRRARAGVVPGPRRDRRLAGRDQHRPVSGRQRDRDRPPSRTHGAGARALRPSDLRGGDRAADHTGLVDRVRPAALPHRCDRAAADRRAVGNLPSTSSGTTSSRPVSASSRADGTEKLGFRDVMRALGPR